MSVATFLDKAIGYWSPQRGFDRLRHRIAFQNAQRAFDGAKMDRRTGRWITNNASANTEALGAIERLRQRARDMERNNPLVTSACNKFAAHVVGAGLTPRPLHPDENLRRAALDAWKRFVDTADPEGISDYYGLQHLAARAMFTDGEVLRVWTPDGNKPFSHARLLEADHLDDAHAHQPPKDGRFVQGIAFNQNGSRAGYWLFDVHPGESDTMFSGRSSALLAAGQARFWAADQVDHYFHRTRPGQARGVSWLASSIRTLRGLDDIDDATIDRKMMERCIGLVITTPEVSNLGPAVGAQTKNTETGNVEEKFEPGMVLRLTPGEQVQPFTPSVGADNIEFARAKLYSIAASIGLTPHSLTGDVSKANYSSLRAATVDAWAMLDVAQCHVMMPREKQAWRNVMRREAVITGKEEFLNVGSEWSVPVRPWVDPLKDITAKIQEIRSGLQSMPDAMAERGVDWHQQLPETAAFLHLCDSLNIVFDTDPRKTNGSGAAQVAATLLAQPDQQPDAAAAV